MTIIANGKDGWERIVLWNLGPGKPTLHIGQEQIEVATVADVRRALEDRGYTDISINDSRLGNYG